MSKSTIWIAMGLLIPLLAGCGQQKQGKTLQEIKEESLKAMQGSPHGSMMAEDPHKGMDMSMMGMAMEREITSVDGSLTWIVPKAFNEESASGMRLATFKEAANPDAIDVSIVTLTGLAGNVQANLVRWAGQLGLSFGDGELDAFIRSAQAITTRNGVSGWVFDFTSLQKEVDRAATKSMIASIVEMEGSVVFVKMTGTVESVLRNKESFIELTESVGLGQ